jgi:N-acetylmuramoyl-L-alanine amidase
MITTISPNHGSRRGKKIELIVLHSDASPSEEGTHSWILNPASQVSYHKEVHRDGQVVQYVHDEDRAWAVGVGEWNGHTDLNSISLSASFANRNDGKEPLTPIQLVTMRDIVRQWRAKFPAITAVGSHAMVARPMGRKSDPDRAPNFRIEDFR